MLMKLYKVEIGSNPYKGVLSFISRQTFNIIGYQADEFLNNQDLWFTIIHPDDVSKVQEDTETVINGKKNVVRYYRLKHKQTDKYRWMEDRITPVLDDNNNVVSFFGIAYDITERKKNEEKLKNKVKELEKFYQMTVGREMKMTKLKEEIEQLKSELSKYKE